VSNKNNIARLSVSSKTSMKFKQFSSVVLATFITSLMYFFIRRVH